MMSTDQPSQAATEAAVAGLLRLALLEIRFLTAPLIEDQSNDALLKRRDQINEIADTCHNLPGLLNPEQRHQLIDLLRHNWEASSPRKRRWMRHCWDHLGYDYGWLIESGGRTAGQQTAQAEAAESAEESPTSPPAASTKPASGGQGLWP
jgi:hypothetical protein